MIREYSIYKTLKKLSKQRVGMVLEPGNVWVIEKAMPRTEENNENLQTCLMRGWIEVLYESVPMGQVNDDGSIHSIYEQPVMSDETIYRLTDGGWNAIHRTHVITMLGAFATLLGIALTLG